MPARGEAAPGLNGGCPDGGARGGNDFPEYLPASETERHVRWGDLCPSGRVWLVTEGKQKADDFPREFWDCTTADGPVDLLMNNWFINALRAQSYFGEINLNPYVNPASRYARRELQSCLEELVDFDRLPELFETSCPMLLMGAVNVTNGEFKVFKDEEITVKSVLASAALPTVFEVVEQDGYIYWDGLLSQYQPIRDLPQTDCDEIWVVQINQHDVCHDKPRAMKEIFDRHNEHAGNLSLNQEVFCIGKINQLIREGVIEDSNYRVIDVDRIVMERELDRASKFNRSEAFIQEMIEYDREKAVQRRDML